MPNFTLQESLGKFDTLYGNFTAPIVSCVEDAAQAWEEKAIAPLIFREQGSSNWAEGYTSTTAADEWEPVGENGAHPENGFEEGYSKVIKNETWKSRLAISRELADDNKIGEMLNRSRKFTNAYYLTRERFFARMLSAALEGNKAMSVNGREFECACADGEALFSANHKPKAKGKVQSNRYKDAFSPEALFAGMTAMQNLKGDNNETLNICPDTIVIPNIAALKKDVIQVIGSYNEAATANNDINPVFGKLDIIVWPYLNDFITGSPWILMDSQFMQYSDCAIYQNRVPMEVKDKIGDNDEYIFDGYARFGGGFVDFRGLMAFGCATGSTL